MGRVIDIDEADVRHGWQKYSAWKRTPSSGHEASGEEFDTWLRSVKSAAWDEGFDAGERDVFEHETFDEPCIRNPYREADE